ncbi:hypothetical protein HanHA300_Chr07g0241241 [Helianthus annuus]|nr:hypothetical protein HanHA300_Chr07g0241241 [Helianthus annuus]KAJ0563024.1 hypothetical protein HanHA89_Chr07g0258401 [Helianthus annuus]KAJ0728395.1 hypothetical protein HanLR1_Chr07g0241111 [Helianthus annuus]
MMLPFNDSIEKTLKSSIALHRIYYSDSSLLIVDLLNQINLKVYLFLIHSFHLFSEYSEDLCSHVLCLPLQVHYHHWRYCFRICGSVNRGWRTRIKEIGAIYHSAILPKNEWKLKGTELPLTTLSIPFLILKVGQ